MANGHGKKPEDFKKQMEDNFKVAPSDYSHVKKVIGIVSGKGGVGKSLVTGLSATAMSKKGYKTAIMDADITGPSIPKMFGIGKANYADENQLLIPATTEGGIKIMSLNMLMDNETDPVVWRGPVIAGIVKQFWSDVNWGDVDFMFVDMPPGTGDVPLTVFQSLPVDGIIVVSTPQELVEMIVEKAINMANMMNIPVLGVVENMSYMKCPHCGEPINVFGESGIEKYAASKGLDVLGRLPLDPTIAGLCDAGKAEDIENEYMDSLVYVLEGMIGAEE
ncbi:MAG: Mrp/NBP35 family ATP-binding protein [Butyrivibrio sp.]|uniref:P-loop NTPase n=1 Tax=Butyrivibrio sp. TaxID=28121 RepID=UPI0025C14722|nr:Mrp/NBP35 family ATP-binding protein [Butyrivibrio sp.]MBQ6588594.1 Mrp/NBP35 family ATP-binding protein [Butyrivibrio sp.]